MKKLIYILLFILPISACQNKEGVKLPNEVRWVTQSIEYSSVCEQIYNSASSVLQNQFEGLDRPIIVMDLDETVLNNVQYQVELFEKSGITYARLKGHQGSGNIAGIAQSDGLTVILPDEKGLYLL